MIYPILLNFPLFLKIPAGKKQTQGFQKLFRGMLPQNGTKKFQKFYFDFSYRKLPVPELTGCFTPFQSSSFYRRFILGEFVEHFARIIAYVCFDND